MKRKLMEKKSERAKQVAAMETALGANDTAAFNTAKAAVEALNTEITQMETVLAEKSRYDDPQQPPIGSAGEPEQKVSGYHVMSKLLHKQNLSEKEAAVLEKELISGDNAVSGENLLIPEDVKNDIREMRKTYISAKELVNVVPVDTLSGSTNFESGTPSGLTDFDDGDTIATEDNPTFVKKAWKIGFRGKLIPVSRILSNLATGLKAYLNRWFVRNAIISENAAIFGTLKSGYNNGTPKDIAGWAELKHSITVDLDPSCLLDGVIVTNQNGFACLDAEHFADGKPVLQDNPADKTKKLFQGLPIKVYPNAQLPDLAGGAHPVIYGSAKSGVDFMEYDALLFDVSEHFLFNKNQDCMRVIEGFDVVSTDTDAYIYGAFTATPAAEVAPIPVIVTEPEV